jgi:hypothetical protein
VLSVNYGLRIHKIDSRNVHLIGKGTQYLHGQKVVMNGLDPAFTADGSLRILCLATWAYPPDPFEGVDSTLPYFDATLVKNVVQYIRPGWA